ncbi:hypothetical protein E2C01_025282 [Portunus trituberculatus]|uniref:Uncharacterized protein n=1 Tax=Portunus trituberculatus TaxID=210409 RepID=A0A5B7ECU7_PORTR|nr:hypothetical protein [Portunus trituberculatus]
MYTAYLVEMKWLTAQKEVHVVSLCKGFNSAPSYYRPISETWMNKAFLLLTVWVLIKPLHYHLLMVLENYLQGRTQGSSITTHQYRNASSTGDNQDNHHAVTNPDRQLRAPEELGEC